MLKTSTVRVPLADARHHHCGIWYTLDDMCCRQGMLIISNDHLNSVKHKTVVLPGRSTVQQNSLTESFINEANHYAAHVLYSITHCTICQNKSIENGKCPPNRTIMTNTQFTALQKYTSTHWTTRIHLECILKSLIYRKCPTLSVGPVT